MHDCIKKLKPLSFCAAKVILNDKKSKASLGIVSEKKFQITAKKLDQAKVIPVSLEDVPRVCVFSFYLSRFRFRLFGCEKI